MLKNTRYRILVYTTIIAMHFQNTHYVVGKQLILSILLQGFSAYFSWWLSYQ